MENCDFCGASGVEVFVMELASRAHVCKNCAIRIDADSWLKDADVDARGEAEAEQAWESSEECHQLDMRS